ncbi:MAG: hypothetical protein ACPGQD_06135 [Planctomycetota bacterium]
MSVRSYILIGVALVAAFAVGFGVVELTRGAPEPAQPAPHVDAPEPVPETPPPKPPPPTASEALGVGDVKPVYEIVASSRVRGILLQGDIHVPRGLTRDGLVAQLRHAAATLHANYASRGEISAVRVEAHAKDDKRLAGRLEWSPSGEWVGSPVRPLDEWTTTASADEDYLLTDEQRAAKAKARSEEAAAARLKMNERRLQAISTAVAGQGRECPLTSDLGATWQALKRSLPDDPNRKAVAAAVRRLERCRKKALKEVKAGLAKDRERFANHWTYLFLEADLNVRCTATGRGKRTLKIKWALMSDVTVHRAGKGGNIWRAVADGSIYPQVRAAGFTTVRFDSAFHWWKHEVSGALDDDDAAARRMSSLGIGEPMVLE